MVKIKKYLAALLMAFGLVGAALVLAPSSAQAADAWVYVVVRPSACGISGATVKGIQGQALPTGWSTNWDTGDDIIYPRIRLNVRNTLNLNLACYIGSRIVGYRVLTAYITPTYHQQTWWVG